MSEEDFISRVSGNLRFLRHLHRFTQREVANRLQISRSTYSTIENGERGPSLFICAVLADIYVIPVEALYKTDMTAAALEKIR